MPSPLLPPLQELSTSSESLLSFLSLLLEPTPILKSLLVPQLEDIFSHPEAAPTDYGDILRTAEGVLDTWTQENKTEFVEGHPRIGEGDVLSELSKKEQGVGGPPTKQETLDRLKHLNTLYEQTYPRLRYITFVAGRPRAAIAVEMEQLLGDSPVVKEVGSAEWESELERAVIDVWRIGHARLGALEKSD